MSNVLFNLHDIFLVMTVLLSVIFACNIYLRRLPGQQSELLLVGFLVCQALLALHELTLYGVKLRLELLAFAPNLLFVTSLAFCIDGLLLYLYVKSFRQKNHRNVFFSGIYAIPLLGYLVYLIAIYYSLETQAKVDAIKDWVLINTWHFILVDFALKGIRLACGVSAFILFRNMCKKSQKPQSTLMGKPWVEWIVLSFSCLFAAQFILSTIKVWSYFNPLPIDLMINFGVGIYYLGFGVTCLLLCGQIRVNFLAQSNERVIPAAESNEEDEQPKNAESSDVCFKSDIVNRIEHFMSSKKPYLNSELSIEELAFELSLSVKDLSVTLNRHYQMNFFEFINRYRIQEAKHLLVAQKEKSVTDIYYEVGFNSKSVFYSYFKKSEGKTPSEYRRQISQVA
jgi:AraC-like DNA-binding protein